MLYYVQYEMLNMYSLKTNADNTVIAKESIYKH